MPDHAGAAGKRLSMERERDARRVEIAKRFAEFLLGGLIHEPFRQEFGARIPNRVKTTPESWQVLQLRKTGNARTGVLVEKGSQRNVRTPWSPHASARSR